MEKLSGNFSTNDLQEAGGSCQALDSCSGPAPNEQNKAKSQTTSQDMLM